MGQGQVAGAGDREKFRGALDDAENDRFDNVHGSALYERAGEK
jgi:hypothetical protein